MIGNPAARLPPSPPPSREAGGPTRARRGGWPLLILAALTMAAWAAAPALLRHLAHQEPLLFERLPLGEPEPAGGRAYRVELATAPADAQWSAGFAHGWGAGFARVFEDERELERVASGLDVRERGAGSYAVIARAEETFVLLAASDDTDPRANGRRYTVRRPRELAPRTARGLLVAFAALNLTTLCLLALGLKRRGLLPAAAPLALQTATCLLVLALLEGRLPESSDDLLGEKLRQFAAVAPEIDTVFLGSSRVYRHLDPATFDATFAEHGRSARSFNLGVPDMRILETLALAERLLRSAPGVESLIVEAEAEPLFIREENRATQRVRRWHDLGTLERAIPALLARGEPWPETAVAVLDRLDLFAWRASQIGRGLDAIDALLSKVESRPARWIEPENRGFLALDADRRAPRTDFDRADLERRWRDLHEAVPAWERTVARLRASSPEGSLTDPLELEWLAELEQLADRHRVELVFVLSPRPERRPNLVHAAETGVVSRLIRFDDPDRHPQFYALGGRYDRHHLDGEAAGEMTRLLALELLAVDGPNARPPGKSPDPRQLLQPPPSLALAGRPAPRLREEPSSLATDDPAGLRR